MPSLRPAGFNEVGFPSNLAPLEDSAATARLRAILTSRALHDMWAEYDRIATCEDAIIGALGAHFWHRAWHEHGSVTPGTAYKIWDTGTCRARPTRPILRRFVTVSAPTLAPLRCCVGGSSHGMPLRWTRFLPPSRSLVSARRSKCYPPSFAPCAVHGARRHAFITLQSAAPWNAGAESGDFAM